MPNVEHAGQCGGMTSPEVVETATKPSPTPLQEYSLGGCTIDMLPANCQRRGISFRCVIPSLIQVLVRLCVCVCVYSALKD